MKTKTISRLVIESANINFIRQALSARGFIYTPEEKVWARGEEMTRIYFQANGKFFTVVNEGGAQ